MQLAEVKANAIDVSLVLNLSKIFPTSCLHAHTHRLNKKDNIKKIILLVQKKEIKEANPLKFKYTCYYYTYGLLIMCPNCASVLITTSALCPMQASYRPPSDVSHAVISCIYSIVKPVLLGTKKKGSCLITCMHLKRIILCENCYISHSHTTTASWHKTSLLHANTFLLSYIS